MPVHEMSIYHGRRGPDWVIGQMPGMRQFQTLQECSRARFSAVFCRTREPVRITPSARVHCILERMLVSLTKSTTSVNSTPVRVFQKTVCSTNMTFRTSWGISFHEYLVPLFSVRVSLRTQRTSSVDPERTSSGLTRSYPSKVRPYPVETQVDPGRIRVGEPDWPASGRTRLSLIRATQTGPHPDKPTWPDPGKFKQTPAYSSKLRTNTSEPSR